MSAAFLAGWIFIIAGLLFFLTAALGLLRFPDIYTRLHAVTKADTAGLGLLCTGLALHSGSLISAFILLLVWLLVLGSGMTSCQLLARHSREEEAADMPAGEGSDA